MERIQEAYEAGAREFGENRVQELLTKQPYLPPDIRWHFVGHLQTNKVRSLLDCRGAEGRPPVIHSLDRMALAEEIQKQAEKGNLEVEALIQVNTSGEATKAGFDPGVLVGAGSGRPQGEATSPLQTILQFNRIQIRGLMTIGPTPIGGAGQDQIRSCFRRLRLLRDSFPEFVGAGSPRPQGAATAPLHLSMGMSSDFEIAVEEGATLLRIGTAVFGQRA